MTDEGVRYICLTVCLIVVLLFMCIVSGAFK